MTDGRPLSEAALRRRRRRRHAEACVAGQAGGARPVGLSQGSQVSGEAVDVRWHLVTALRCLAESLERQGFLEEAAGTKVPPWCGLAQHGEPAVAEGWASLYPPCAYTHQSAFERADYSTYNSVQTGYEVDGCQVGEVAAIGQFAECFDGVEEHLQCAGSAAEAGLEEIHPALVKTTSVGSAERIGATNPGSSNPGGSDEELCQEVGEESGAEGHGHGANDHGAPVAEGLGTVAEVGNIVPAAFCEEVDAGAVLIHARCQGGGLPAIPPDSEESVVHELSVPGLGEELVCPRVIAGDLKPEGLCALGSPPFENAHARECLAKEVFVAEVGKKGSLCSGLGLFGRGVRRPICRQSLWLVAISILLCFLCCCWYLRVGNHTVSELGRSAQSFVVQEQIFGASTRGELKKGGQQTEGHLGGPPLEEAAAGRGLRAAAWGGLGAARVAAAAVPAAAEGSTELQLSDGDRALVSRDVYVGGAGPAAGNGRKSISKSKQKTVKQFVSKKAIARANSDGQGVWSAEDHRDNLLYVSRGADFVSSDRDGDGTISLPELRLATRRISVSALRPGKVEEIFYFVDKNDNGVLNVTEYLNAVAWFDD